MCPSSTPLSFIDLSACCVQTLRPSTFKSIIFFRSSVEPSADHKCKLDPRKQLLNRQMQADAVIRLLTYFTSLCEEGLCTVRQRICVTGSVQDGYSSLDTDNKVEWFHMSSCWIAHRFYALFAISFVMSVRVSARKNSVPTWRIFIKIFICVFFENLAWKFKFNKNLTRSKVILHKDLYTCAITFRSVFLRNRNVSDKCFRENQNTSSFTFNRILFSE